MLNTLLALIISFGKIGLVSLGGGNSMLKLLEYEFVDYRHWLGQEEFIKMLGSTFIFPGLTGVKLSGLIGYKMAGIPGLLIAIISLSLPGLVMAVVGYSWLTHHDGPFLRKLGIGVQYGALALLAAATFSVGQGVVSLYFSWPLALATLIFFLALTFLQLSPFWGFLLYLMVCYFIIS